jgi:hypothetical protein
MVFFLYVRPETFGVLIGRQKTGHDFSMMTYPGSKIDTTNTTEAVINNLHFYMVRALASYPTLTLQDHTCWGILH